MTTPEAVIDHEAPDVIPRKKSIWSRNKNWIFLVGGIIIGAVLSAVVYAVLLRIYKYFPDTNRNKQSFRENYELRNDEIKARTFDLEDEIDSSVCRTNECIDSASFLLKSINFSVNPCDDFYEFACGRWINENPNKSHFRDLRHTANKMTRKILSSPKDENDPKVLNLARKFYASCIDTEELNRVGLEPLLNILEDYGGWPILYDEGTWNSSDFDWMKSIADLRRQFSVSAVYDILINQNTEQNTSLNTVHINEPSLFMPRPFLVDPVKYSDYISAYKKYITNIVLELKRAQFVLQDNSTDIENITSKVNITYIESQAEEIIQFEAYVAYFTREPQDEMYLKNASVTAPLDVLQKLFDDFPAPNATIPMISFKRILERLFSTSGVNITGSELVSMSNFKYIGTIVSLLYITQDEVLANYLHFRLAASLISGTTSNMRNHASDFDNILSGPSPMAEREYTCSSSAQRKFGLAIGYKYMENNLLSREQKIEVETFFEEIRSSLKVLQTVALDWMDEEMHNSTKQKAETIRSCIGFPDWIGNKTAIDAHYDSLHLDDNLGYFQQLLAIRRWEEDTLLKTLPKAFDRECVWKFPFEIQAYYNHGRDAVGLPAGVLQFPFYSKNRPSSLNYGGLGTIIGHEITHGLFYEKGWIQDSDGQFTNMSQCLIDQYNEFKLPEVSSDASVNGQLTLDENFPDHGGILQSYSAFLEHLNENGPEKKLPGLENFDSTQLFFMGFATNWCSSLTKETLLEQILTDHHSPDPFRVFGVLRNFDEFSKSWNCPIGSKMNPGPTNRCSVF